MSDLERARDMYDAWNEGGVDRMIDFWWDDASWEDYPELPDRRIIRGRANVEAHLRGVIELIGDLKMGWTSSKNMAMRSSARCSFES
jgi:ketosteroid isomerase-like protein